MRTKLTVLCVLLSLWFLSPQCGFAAEGRIPISGQYNITAPGRYLLTDNITVTSGYAILITANDVDLDLGGFTVNAASGYWGIDVEGVKNVAISNGTINGGSYGIRMWTASQGRYVIHDVRITNATQVGMMIYPQDYNLPNEVVLEKNVVVREGSAANTIGIVIYSMDGSIVRDNIVSGFSQEGIHLDFCDNSLVENNLVTMADATLLTTAGIKLYVSNSSIVRNNVIRGSGDGIQLGYSDGNVIAHNNSSYNLADGNGIRLATDCQYNNLDGNLLVGHTSGCGIRFESSSSGNVYSNNRTLNNATNVCDLASPTNTDLGNVWWVRGNTSTNPSTDFLGTTDSQPLVLRTVNSERARLDTSGRLGIGTTTPVNRLDVEGAAAVGATYSGSSAAPSNGLIVEGNVGIGTPSPGYRLDVSGSTRVTGAFVDSSGDAGTSGQLLSSTVTGTNWINQSAVNDGDWTISGANEYSAVSGNVGIGTSSPNSKLQVQLDPNGIVQLGLNTGITTYAYHSEASTADGQAALYAYRTRPSQNDGIGYGSNGTNQALWAFNNWGDAYTFGVTGHSWLDYNRSGAVLGAEANSGSPWGALAYRASSGTQYGGYFTSYVLGTGLHDWKEGIGLGSFGGLMGGWVRGEEYGLFSSGKRYGIFTDGNTFSTGYHAFVNENAGEKTVSYSVASPTVDVIFHGKARLEPGQTRVTFPSELAKMLSPQSPVSVLLSPIGTDAALSLSAVTAQGFEVAPSRATPSPREFYWIAIGKRAGYESVETPEEILRPDFETNMQQVAFNENDLEGSGLGMYFDGALRFGAPPQSQMLREDREQRALRSSAPSDTAPPPPAEESTQVTPPMITSAESVPGGLLAERIPPIGTGMDTLPVAMAVEAGDVLVMIPNDGEALHPCIGAADPMVAGIAVTNEHDGFASVAGAGYAVVKADATLYPIAKGDLLVTSPVPGHAMKALHPRIGTVIGKAMADLGTGTSLIKVLVMLR